MKLLGAVLPLALAGLLGYAFRGHADAKVLVAIQDTNSALQKKLGEATQAQGHAVDYQTLARQVQAAMGAHFAALTHQQTYTAVTAATAEVPAQTSVLLTLPATPDVLLNQDRGGLPALTAVRVTTTGNTLTSQWFNHREVFHLSHATWRTEKDGLRAAARLQREVFEPSGAKLGPTEEVPVTGADAYFSADEVARIAPFPKYTLHLGSTAGHGPAVLLQRHWTRTFSTAVGRVGRENVILASYSWGKQ